MKSAIRENGAVGVSYHSYPSSNKTYYNETHNAFWNPVDTNTNHAVIAVGWDDNFPKEYFNTVNGKQPENDGAWLIRNSWTTTPQASYRSYFWMSYEDTSLAESAWVFEADTAFPYDNHYYYDSQIYSTSSYNGTSEMKFANVYTVNGAAGAETETLEAVDFNVSNIGTNGSSYKVEIYKDLTGETPDTGTLASTTEGNVYFRGQYTVKLAEPVVLEKGSSYAVVVSFGVPSTSIALTRNISGSGRYYSATAHCEGKSYYRFSAYSGSKWTQDKSDYVIGALTVDGNTSGVNHVTGVSLDKTSLTMEEGAITTLSATVVPEDADDQSLTWESDAPAVATVDENGKVTAVEAGSATITVTTTDGGYTASCNVTVKKAVVNVTGVSLDQETLKLSPGQSETLTATITPENADDLGVNWTSDDSTVATVDKGGKVTAVAAGETTVTVTTNDGGYEAECVVTVSEDLQIRVENVAATITTGMTMKVEVTVIPETAETPEYVWSSSDPTVATVDENGEIKALAAGTTTITVATADGKAETSFVLTVVEITIAVKGIGIDQVTMKLEEGETKKLAAWVTPTNATNRNITFSSGDEDVAIVDKNGVVTAIAAGTTGITATSEDGEFSKTCTVTVTAPVVEVSGVSLDENELELTVGEEKTLTAVVEPENATNKKVSWSSDNEAAATVDENGKVTAVAAGEAMITVTTEDGSYTDECLVTVQTQTVALTGLEIDPETLEMIVGETAALVAFLTPENTTETDLLWTSSAANVVCIDSVLDNDAEITALAAGTATITVSNADKTITATCEVTVEEAPAPGPDYGKTPRVITEKDGSIVVYVDNKPVSDYTGIAILGTEENAPWVYMENGQRNQKYTGYVDYDGSKFYVSGGTLDTGLNGVMIDPHSNPLVWYFNSNGQVQTQHVGLALYDGEWFYIENGKVATGMNAFVSYDGGLFAVGAGRIISEYSGLMQDPENTQTGDWYFFAKGQAQTQYTGLTKYDGHWFYVENGKFDPAYNGTVWYDGAQFEVVNGEAVVE